MLHSSENCTTEFLFLIRLTCLGFFPGLFHQIPC
ncbi:YqaE/Pmp3 family membrane protein [Deinococcus cellulosilyticus]